MTVLQRGWGVEVSQIFDSEAGQKAAELRAAEGTVRRGRGSRQTACPAQFVSSILSAPVRVKLYGGEGRLPL